MLANAEQRSELAADFQQFYQLDLEALLDNGELVKVYELTVNLPMQSRTVRRIDPRMEWDESAYLLALAVDNLSCLRYEQAGGKGHKPEPIERPKHLVNTTKHLDVSVSQVDDLLFGPRTL